VSEVEGEIKGEIEGFLTDVKKSYDRRFGSGAAEVSFFVWVGADIGGTLLTTWSAESTEVLHDFLKKISAIIDGHYEAERMLGVFLSALEKLEEGEQ